MRLILPLILCLFLALPAEAQNAANLPVAAEGGQFTAGDEVPLTDGTAIRLDGIAQPFEESDAWREKSRALLSALAAGHKLLIENQTTDRYGDPAGQVSIADNPSGPLWLQGELLKAGLAFVYPPTGREARLAEMLALETAARRAGIGIWSDRAYADVPFDRAFIRYGRFGFIRGAVVDVARVKNLVYVHFGKDWRETFTLAIATHDLRAFRKAGLDPFAFPGKVLRVRGWVKRDIGPMVLATDPAQIEIVTP